MTIKKPSKKKSEYYNYSQAIHYIEDKYGIETRDYLGKFKFSNDKFKEHEWSNSSAEDYQKYKQVYEKEEPEYLDFWHWVIEQYEINNGCVITFDTDQPDAPAWVKEILSLLQKEFCEKDSTEIEFMVEW